MAYRVFVRNWWRWERSGLCGPGARKTTLVKVETEDEARRICADYARTHKHKRGPLSRKAEYEEIW